MTAVPPYLWRIQAKTPSGCLKLLDSTEPYIYLMFIYIKIYVMFYIRYVKTFDIFKDIHNFYIYI